MKIDKAKELYDQRNVKRWELRVRKCKDYSSTEDIHFNFNQRALLIDILKPNLAKPSQVALFDAVLKIQRIVNLLNQNKDVQNESVEDSFTDLLNYVDLSLEILLDKRE
jgi:hypothetical protein